MKYLFLFTISPVQAFIAQARKSQDLFAGSLILSDLMKKVHTELEKTNAEIIFPQLPDKEKNIDKYEKSSATHRILAIVETDAMQNFGNKLEHNIQEHFLETMAEPVWSLYPNAKKQLENYFSFYWTAKQYNKDENHLTQYKELEKLLGGVKNARFFIPFEEEAGRKCALNGEYNVKFYRQKDEKETREKLVKSKIYNSDFLLVPIENKKEITKRQLAEAEGLSAISFLKRVYEKDKIKSFPATAEIALMNLLQNDLLKETKQKFEQLFEKNYFQKNFLNNKQFANSDFFKKFNSDFDIEYFFKENITDKKFPFNEQLNAVKNFQKKEIAENIGDGYKYYAIIQFDGDNMGKWLSGEFVDGDIDYHKELSACLSNFSKKASDCLKEPFGKAIYAGGDDFLGFVNIHYLFKVLTVLRKLFETEVNKPIQDKYKEKFRAGDKHLTFSAGISIAHYKDPLSIAMNWASDMQDAAKEKTDKNSFGIVALKGSGEIEKTVLSFGNNVAKNAEILKQIIEKLENKEFSTTFITNLNREFSLLINEKGEIELERELVYTELVRLIERAANFKDDKKVKSKQFADLIILLYEGKDFQNFLSLLNICDFFIRKTH